VEAALKDEVLHRLSGTANVAQFVSFAPGEDPSPRFIHLSGASEERTLVTVDEAIRALLTTATEHSVNVRSFQLGRPKSNDFFYGLRNADEAVARVRALAAAGFYTIVNETIDVYDGGVSGVSYGDIIEFAPGDTPRAVEKAGTAAASRDLGLRLLKTVYGFEPDLPEDQSLRVEFSIHPLRRGVRHEHTVIWEEERLESLRLDAYPRWPNNFSRLIGDKTFGLLIADAIGMTVPKTTAITRSLSPFGFGQATSTHETWIRTAPREQVPGRFTTRRGWIDPFQLLKDEDPDGDTIGAVLAQEAVDARYSGAAAEAAGELIIEGVAGLGDAFMVGDVPPDKLPFEIVRDVRAKLVDIRDQIGAARLEWVHDGTRVWVIQLHSGSISSSGRIIYPGAPSVEHRFPVEQGLEELRNFISRIDRSREGVILVGNVGITSHFGDVLRSSRVAARIESES
jgi:hypothetical protein